MAPTTPHEKPSRGNRSIESLNREICILEKKLGKYKQQMVELNRKKRLYGFFFKENMAGLYISTPAGRLQLCNQEFLNIFGITSMDQALSMPMDTLYPSPEDRAWFLEVLGKKKRIKGHQQAFRRLDGQPICLVHNSLAVYSKSGRLKYLQGFIQDITPQKELEIQLRKAQKMEAIGNLAGGIAHDFNNILSGIIGNTQLAAARIADPDKVTPRLDNIMAGARRASELIQQVLTFSKQKAYQKKNLSLKGIICEVIKFIRSTIPASIDIKTDLRTNGYITADATQMHRLVMNLCINAARAMHNDPVGTLTVSLARTQDAPGTCPPSNRYLKLDVRDTGHGIDKAHIDRIFEPYFTTNVDGRGTGIGLASVRSIVEAHNGCIKVDSAVNAGSIFTIYLPAADRPGNSRQTPRPEARPETGRGGILLVDDEEQICRTFSDMLRLYGYCTITCRDGQEALDRFAREPDRIDLIITDLNMPKMKGDRFISHVLKIREDIPFIFCSGYCEGFDRVAARKMGASAFLEKPVDLDHLVTRVNQILAKG